MENIELDMNDLLSVDDIPGVHGDIAVVEKFVPATVDSNPAERSVDLSDDYSYARNNMRMMQQMGMEALTVALENARASDAPRMMEVFSTMMNSMTSLNKEAMNLHKNMKDITSEQTKTAAGAGQPTQQIQTQNVFVGTPAELMGKVGTQYESRAAEEKAAIEGEVIEDAS